MRKISPTGCWVLEPYLFHISQTFFNQVMLFGSFNQGPVALAVHTAKVVWCVSFVTSTTLGDNITAK